MSYLSVVGRSETGIVSRISRTLLSRTIIRCYLEHNRVWHGTVFVWNIVLTLISWRWRTLFKQRIICSESLEVVRYRADDVIVYLCNRCIFLSLKLSWCYTCNYNNFIDFVIVSKYLDSPFNIQYKIHPYMQSPMQSINRLFNKGGISLLPKKSHLFLYIWKMQIDNPDKKACFTKKQKLDKINVSVLFTILQKYFK